MKPCRCPFVRNAPARQRRWDSLDWVHTTPSQHESPSINACPAPEKRAIGETQIDVEVSVLRGMSRLSGGGSQSPISGCLGRRGRGVERADSAQSSANDAADSRPLVTSG